MRTLLALLLAIATQAADASPALPVVVTWGDLVARPVHDLGGGVRVRLGIQATTCPTGGGVMVYCLAEGFTAPLTGSGEDHLGPLRISVDLEGQERAKLASQWGRLTTETPGLPLYARLIACPTLGRRRVSVTTAAGQVLGTATIVCAAQVPAAWVSLGGSRAANVEQEMGDDRRDTVHAHIGFVGSVRSLPACDGLEPLAHYRTGSGQDPEPLPVLLPEKPDPRLRLSWDGHLVLDSDVPLSLCQPDMCFLARWWISDVAWTPPVALGVMTELRGGLVHAGVRRLRLHVDVDAALLRAKPGDRIGVQLLFSPHGIVPLNDHDEVAAQHALAEPIPAMLSNRVDFLLP